MISIIVSTKNNNSTIKFVLNSILPLTNKLPVELIVVDGRSKDGTQEKVEEFFRINKSYYVNTILLTDPGRSLSLSRHIGFKASTGDVLIFLDGDTPLAPDFSLHLEEEIKNCDVIAPRFAVVPIDEATKVFAAFINLVESVENENVFTNKPSILAPARVYRRKVLETLKGYPPLSKFFGEDRIVTALAIMHGFRYNYSSQLRLLKIDDPGYSAYWRKHFRYGYGMVNDVSPQGRRILRDYIIFRRFSYLNTIIPIFSLIYMSKQYKLKKKNVAQIMLMKQLIDISMFVGELIGIFRRMRGSLLHE